MPIAALRFVWRKTPRWLLALCTVAFTGACTTPPRPPLQASLLQDSLFEPAPPLPKAEEVFAMSPAMLHYARQNLSSLGRSSDARRDLIEALYSKSRLQLDYDASLTRNAAQAFEARAGNCLSLVIMTASFARHLGMPVSFQAVSTDEFYTRSGNLTLANNHVNLVLGVVPSRSILRPDHEDLIVDFLPMRELRGQRSQTLDERTVLAMYFNNRAAEELVQGRINVAYWLAREAFKHDGAFVAAANTLGVIYDRAGHKAEAEFALRSVLAHDERHVSSLANLVNLLERQGRSGETAALRERLAQLQPVPPFKRFYEGQQAMAEGAFERAYSLFLEELRLQPFQDEVHFWAAQAAWRLGRNDDTMRHLRHAMENSLTRDSSQRYSGKLENLRHSTRLQ